MLRRVATARQHVEGVELYHLIVLAGVQPGEVRVTRIVNEAETRLQGLGS
jgi:hypothetical protein